MAELIFERSTSGDGIQSGILKIVGEATVEHAEQIKQALLEGLNTVDRLQLDCEQVTELDFFAIQLFCSAHRTSVAWEKRLSFSGGRAGHLQRAIEASGFSRHVGCALCPDGERCLWT